MSVNHVATAALDHEFSRPTRWPLLCGGIAPSRERSFTCSIHRLFSFFLGGSVWSVPGRVSLSHTARSESERRGERNQVDDPLPSPFSLPHASLAYKTRKGRQGREDGGEAASAEAP